MTTDILSIVPFSDSMKPEAREYLRKSISKETAEGVFTFVQKQSQLFNQYAEHLAEVLRVIDNAPEGVCVNLFSEGFVAWLRENGVSSSRTTQLKGYLRLRTRALGLDSRYSSAEKEVIKALEVEKAYLFGRLTFQGQSIAFEMHKEDGRLSLRDLRELVKTNEYDPCSQWKEHYEGKPAGHPFEDFDSSKPPHSQSEDLAVKLQSVMDQFMSLRSHWEKDRRILNLIDYGQIGFVHGAMRCFNDAYDPDDMGLPF
jgi:hypothetical protein